VAIGPDISLVPSGDNCLTYDIRGTAYSYMRIGPALAYEYDSGIMVQTQANRKTDKSNWLWYVLYISLGRDWHGQLLVLNYYISCTPILWLWIQKGLTVAARDLIGTNQVGSISTNLSAIRKWWIISDVIPFST